MTTRKLTTNQLISSTFGTAQIGSDQLVLTANHLAQILPSYGSFGMPSYGASFPQE